MHFSQSNGQLSWIGTMGSYCEFTTSLLLGLDIDGDIFRANYLSNMQIIYRC